MKVQNEILYRNVDSKKHYHVKLRAYLFDVELLQKLPAWKELRIITKLGRVYRITKSDFDKRAYLHTGYGKPQMVIAVKYLVQVAENTNVKTIAVLKESHNLIKAKAKAENKTIAQYVESKCI